ncbi:hypothetical protein EV421DRAFT_1912583 [Armillaria borealis]|uniref:C2H2-type domain-containing protein n=1 Tax=Armillaria borealis TaxID=47425 RepID=A0AA39IVN1_9AGAR|nr:hypothetical protein EV421DRAFT_1912583 [Armillaria borealis]
MSSIDIDLKATYYCGVELVHGISTALDYLLWQEAVPLLDLDVENINVFWDVHNGPILTIDSTLVDISEGKTSHRESEDLISGSLSVMNDVLSKILSEVNRILYADNVDRSHELIQVDTEQTADVPGHAPDSEPSYTGNSVALSTSSVRQSTPTAVKPRRELVWKVADGHDANLKEISRQYKLLLDGRSHSPRPIRQFWAPRMSMTDHPCMDYRREEVTLMHVPFNNRVLVDMTPSIDEICLVCGKYIREYSKCDVCKKKFRRKEHLELHMNVHKWQG